MSLTYTLEIGGALRDDEIEAALCEVPEYRRASGSIVAPDLKIDISAPGALGVQMIEEEFGFTPVASVGFRRYTQHDPAGTRVRLIRGCMAILARCSYDAVLLFNGETIIFRRRDGRFLLNPLEGFWTDDVLALVPEPYVLEAMPHL